MSRTIRWWCKPYFLCLFLYSYSQYVAQLVNSRQNISLPWAVHEKCPPPIGALQAASPMVSPENVLAEGVLACKKHVQK